MLASAELYSYVGSKIKIHIESTLSEQIQSPLDHADMRLLTKMQLLPLFVFVTSSCSYIRRGIQFQIKFEQLSISVYVIFSLGIRHFYTCIVSLVIKTDNGTNCILHDSLIDVGDSQ